MPTTIITKFGNGAPSDENIRTGELAIDMKNSVLYTKDGNDNIIQLGGGDVNWNQIIGIPEEIINIIDINADGYIDLKALLALAEKNETDIGTLNTDLALLAERVSANETNISLHDGRLTTLENVINGTGGILERLGDVESDIVDIKADVIDNTTAIGENKYEIELINQKLNQDLTGLVLAGGYSAASNTITSVKSEAASAGFKEGDPLNLYLGNKYAGYYFIVNEAGILQNTGSPARSDNENAFVGDWLVSDGPHWLHFNFSQESTLWGTISGDITAQDDLTAALELKFDKDGGTLSCGRY